VRSGGFKDGELVRLFGTRADDVLRSTAWYKQATPRCTGTMRIRDVRASQRGTIHSSSHMCRNCANQPYASRSIDHS
jgi:hypothetical protein